jgi:hypothetical protein
MDDTLTIVLLTIFGVLLVRWVLFFLLAGGDTHRMGLVIRASWRTLRDPEFAATVEPLLAPPAPKEEAPPKPDARPLRLLALLQREGRLLDFLMEDLTHADPGQIVDGVKEIQPKCQATLKEHLVLEPVLAEPENTTVEVPPGFDPSTIRLVGNVTGQPPFRGTLLHAGWRVKDIKLAPPPEGQDEMVLMPAEVELP